MTAKKIILGVLFILLLVPFIQRNITIFTIKPLDGNFTIASAPSFDFKDWFSGEFQKKYEKSTEDNIGLRNFFIRINNQIDYSLFRIGHGDGVVVGKDGYIFLQNYIDAWKGDDFKGDTVIDKITDKLKFIQDKLKEKNKLLITILAPSKVRAYSEFLPDRCVREKNKRTNYDAYRISLKQKGVNSIDFINLFSIMKDTASYPLFPKQGAHWSYYGSWLSIDTLVKFIERKKGMDLVNYNWNNIKVSDSLEGTDYDTGVLLNLLTIIPHPKMAYPEIVFESNLNKVRPLMLTIGDSYFWNIYYSGLLDNVIKGKHFWYYNHEIYPPGADGKPGIVDDEKYISEIEKNDIIILEQTECNFNNIGFGFIDKVYSAYTNYTIQPNNYSNPVGDFSDWVRKLNETKSVKISPSTTRQENKFPFLRELGKAKIAIKADNEKWVCADPTLNGELSASRSDAKEWETFTLVFFEKNKCLISSSKNLFVCSDKNMSSRLLANRASAGEWELFTIEDLGDGRWAIKNSESKYVTYSLDEKLGANSDKLTESGKFIIEWK